VSNALQHQEKYNLAWRCAISKDVGELCQTFSASTLLEQSEHLLHAAACNVQWSQLCGRQNHGII